jgi:1-acyl-sn-glycerol-3-phosphate acyltransferase
MPPSQDSAVDEAQPPPLAISDLRGSCERHLAHHFHTLRLSRTRRPNFTAARQRPLLIYCNHSSWWDPLICMQLAGELLPGRRHFVPMDAVALQRHPWLGRLGFFAVEAEGARGVRQLFEQATHILERPEATLWLAGGLLADPRKRPAELYPGLGHLAARGRHTVLLPLALEYPFWEDLRPEALARFGDEQVAEEVGMRAADWAEVLLERLQKAQDGLAAEALSRDESSFEVMLEGGSAPRPLWPRLKALLRRRRPQREDRPVVSE